MAFTRIKIFDYLFDYYNKKVKTNGASVPFVGTKIGQFANGDDHYEATFTCEILENTDEQQDTGNIGEKRYGLKTKTISKNLDRNFKIFREVTAADGTKTRTEFLEKDELPFTSKTSNEYNIDLFFDTGYILLNRVFDGDTFIVQNLRNYGSVVDASFFNDLQDEVVRLENDKHDSVDVIDNLDSTDGTESLSANMGRELSLRDVHVNPHTRNTTSTATSHNLTIFRRHVLDITALGTAADNITFKALDGSENFKNGDWIVLIFSTWDGRGAGSWRLTNGNRNLNRADFHNTESEFVRQGNVWQHHAIRRIPDKQIITSTDDYSYVSPPDIKKYVDDEVGGISIPTVPGFATNQEVIDGTSTNKIVSPSTLDNLSVGDMEAYKNSNRLVEAKGINEFVTHEILKNKPHDIAEPQFYAYHRDIKTKNIDSSSASATDMVRQNGDNLKTHLPYYTLFDGKLKNTSQMEFTRLNTAYLVSTLSKKTVISFIIYDYDKWTDSTLIANSTKDARILDSANDYFSFQVLDKETGGSTQKIISNDLKKYKDFHLIIITAEVTVDSASSPSVILKVNAKTTTEDFEQNKFFISLKQYKVNTLTSIFTYGASDTSGVQSDWTQTDSLKVDYIKNKPTFTTPIQSDWTQSDTSKLDFVKNKPDIAPVAILKDSLYRGTAGKKRVHSIITQTGIGSSSGRSSSKKDWGIGLNVYALFIDGNYTIFEIKDLTSKYNQFVGVNLLGLKYTWSGRSNHITNRNVKILIKERGDRLNAGSIGGNWNFNPNLYYRESDNSIQHGADNNSYYFWLMVVSEVDGSIQGPHFGNFGYPVLQVDFYEK